MGVKRKGQAATFHDDDNDDDHLFRSMFPSEHNLSLDLFYLFIYCTLSFVRIFILFFFDFEYFIFDICQTGCP